MKAILAAVLLVSAPADAELFAAGQPVIVTKPAGLVGEWRGRFLRIDSEGSCWVRLDDGGTIFTFCDRLRAG